MKVAILQFDINFNDPIINRKKVLEMIERASGEQPDVIVLPEMWNTSFNFKNIHLNADEKGQPTLKLLSEKAKEHGVHIVAGSIADNHAGNIYNRTYVLNREGKVVHHYDKIHLVHHAQEDQYISQGNEIDIFELDGIKCGVIICYDLRFPELCRTLALKGAEVIFAPVQWFETRLEHYETLCRARALENQIYFVTANRIGKEFKATFPGQSMVVDPWGKIIAQMGSGEEILHGHLNLDLIYRTRQKITCYQDRRPDLYQLD